MFPAEHLKSATACLYSNWRPCLIMSDWSGSTLATHHQFLMLQFCCTDRPITIESCYVKAAINILKVTDAENTFPQLLTRCLSEETSGEYKQNPCWRLAFTAVIWQKSEGTGSHFTFLVIIRCDMCFGVNIYIYVHVFVWNVGSGRPCISRLSRHPYRFDCALHVKHHLYIGDLVEPNIDSQSISVAIANDWCQTAQIKDSSTKSKWMGLLVSASQTLHLTGSSNWQ